MPPVVPTWPARLVQLGRRRTMVLLTGFSVLASLLLVAIFAVAFAAEPADLPQYFIPAFVVPAVVAPIVIHVLLDLAFALDAAHAQAARQQRELERVQQLDLVGRLASGLAHDLNNLLTVVRASVEALGGAETNADLAAIEDAAQRGARLTRRLLAISRHDEILRTRQPLAPVLEDVHAVLRRVLPTDVQYVPPALVPEVELELDVDAIQQALLNLVLNARDALRGPGRIEIVVQRTIAEGAPWLVVAVRDDGPGMSAELLARATEPFFTTKAAHEGTGLGLSIVRRTMEQHGGRLDLTSVLGEGSTASLWFPVPEPRATHAPHTHDIEIAATSSPGSCRVLVVDDEADVRQVTARVIERLGHRVVSAADAAEAHAWLAANGPVDLIVTDVMMPGATGVELLQRLRAGGDHTPVLLVSGFSLERLEETITTDPAVRFRAKPWTPDALAADVSALLLAAQRAEAPRAEAPRAEAPRAEAPRAATPRGREAQDVPVG